MNNIYRTNNYGHYKNKNAFPKSVPRSFILLEIQLINKI